ncbi:MAG: hypothetical protein U0031_19055 [Thermomicrobiales bacterium]
MRRLAALTSLIVVLLACMVIPCVAAQEEEATPEMVVTGDITVAQTNLGILPSLVPPPAAVNYFRVDFPPGSVLAYPPGDPGLGLWIIESGTMTLRNFSGDIVVARASRQATPGAEATETLAAGTETRLGPGDGFVWTPFLGGEVRNDGPEMVVFISFDIRQDVEAAAAPADQSATPTS